MTRATVQALGVRATLLISALILSPLLLRAAPPVGASYLTLNPFPRVASMGGTGVALASDASALFVNPAGLGFAEQQEIAAAHSQLFQDSSYDSLNYVRPFNGAEGTPRRTLGYGLVYLTQGSLEGRDESRAPTGSYSASDMAVYSSYAQKITPVFSAGVTAKFLQEHIANASANGIAVDAGTRLKTRVKGLSLGAAVTNLGPSMKFVSERFSLPTLLQLGTSYELSRVNLALDGALPLTGGKGRLGFGAEFAPVSTVVMRAGYLFNMGSAARTTTSTEEQFSQFAGLSAGLGLRLGSYQIDYALVPHEQLGETQQISFSARFK